MILVPIHKAAQSTSLPPYQQGIDGEDDTPQEWSLLELNGEIQTPRQSHDNDDAIELGSIEYDHEGTPTMIIASHELKGKVQPLKQPFVVINKKRDTIYSSSSNQQCVSSLKRADPNDCHDDDIHLDVPNKKRHCSKGRKQVEDGMVVCIDDNGDDSMEIESGKEQGQEEFHQLKFEGGYEIAGVVTSKILFDRYPKSIMK